MGHRDWTSAAAGADSERLLQARIERELPSLLALARRLTHEEHGAQDALERAWRARHQLRDLAAAAGWLRSILARTVVDAHRRQSDLTTVDPRELDMLIPGVDDSASVVAAAEDDRALRAALRARARRPDRARAP